MLSSLNAFMMKEKQIQNLLQVELELPNNLFLLDIRNASTIKECQGLLA